MSGFVIEPAVKKRKCHVCNGVIAPGEYHLTFYYLPPRHRENMCTKCVSDTYSNLIIKAYNKTTTTKETTNEDNQKKSV